jgi:dTDP-4-amino-4,6-dideoxygalactose transaminase
MQKMINFNNPVITGNKFPNYMKLSKLKHYSANGYFTKKCQQWLVKNIKCKEALLVQSCTSALEMCALLLNIKKGDEIIMPSYTFVSTANAFVLRGGIPIFIDIDTKTLNIDAGKIERAITKKTKAIVAVHYAGISCEMETIIKIAKKYKLYVIEDAAQGILSCYKGKALGSIGDLATLSFHDSKNIHCGEGGALLINNQKFIKKAKIIRDKGTNRDDFNKNIVKKYTWVNLGSSYGLSELNAAFLYAQLLKAKSIIKNRIKIWNIYHNLFSKLEKEKKILRPKIPNYAKNNAHIYYLIIKKNIRDELIKYLKSKNIISLFHYMPLHSSPFFKKFYKSNNSLKNTSLISKTIIRLPLHHKLSIESQKNILNKIVSFCNRKLIIS